MRGTLSPGRVVDKGNTPQPTPVDSSERSPTSLARDLEVRGDVEKAHLCNSQRIFSLRDGNTTAQKGLCRQKRLGMHGHFAACHNVVNSRQTPRQQPQQVFKMSTTQLKRPPAGRLQGRPMSRIIYKRETIYDMQPLA